MPVHELNPPTSTRHTIPPSSRCRHAVESRSRSNSHTTTNVQNILADLHCAGRRAVQAAGAKDTKGWTKAATGYIDAVLRFSLLSESEREREEGGGKWEKYVRLAVRMNKALGGEVSSSWVLAEDKEEKQCISLDATQRCLQARLEVGSELEGDEGGENREGISVVNKGRKERTVALVVNARCCGWTKAGTQCKRSVKSEPALSGVAVNIERFCHQHRQRVLEPSGFYARKTGQWVEFAGSCIPYLWGRMLTML